MVCGWIHDAEFTQLRLKDGQTITLSGALPDIVRVVHRAHERGFVRVSTKAGELQRACGGYHHPSKAFDDLNQRASYKILFDRSWRGFISLQGVAGLGRNQSRNEAQRALL